MQKIDIQKKVFVRSLDKLHAFVAVSRLGSVSKAAGILNLSQSALSHLINDLENSLEVALFERHSRGMRLTIKGESLYQFSKRLLEESELFCTNFLEDQKKPSVLLRGGTHETLAAHIWPNYFKILQSTQPEIKISLTTGRIDGLVECLLARDLDFVVSVEPRKSRILESTKLYGGYLQFFVSPEWIKKNELSSYEPTLSDIKTFPIFTDINAHTRQGMPIPQLLSRVGFTNVNQFEVGSFEAATNLASSGLGIAALPDRNARRAIESKCLVRLKIRGIADPKALSYSICLTRLSKSPLKGEIDRITKAIHSPFF